jgi:hypothetical protein
MKNALPFISIIGIAAFVGNMLVIGLGFGLYWQSLDPMIFMEQFGLQFPFLLAPTIGILLPALIATIVLVVNAKGQKDVRKNWIVALVGLMIACTITSAYHLPTNFGFMEIKYSAEEAISKLNLWMLLHWIRTAIVLVSAVFAIKAFQISNNN